MTTTSKPGPAAHHGLSPIAHSPLLGDNRPTIVWSGTLVKIDPVAIDQNALPDVVQDALKPDAPGEQRLLLARAVLPLGPPELVSTLAFLLDDASETVSSSAKTTLEGLPWGVLSSGIGEAEDPGVLDRLAREPGLREEVLQEMMSNRHLSGPTIVFIASKGHGAMLDQIAGNHVMMERHPEIIEALYYNPETRMGTISTVMEHAVREGIDLSHIPGYKEIVESIFGDKTEDAAAEVEEETPQDEQAQLSTEELGEFDAAMEEAVIPDTSGEALEGFLDDEAFVMVLQAAAWEEGPEDDEEEEEDKTALWSRVGKMNIVQKVRLALLGNDFIRSLLIRDSRRVVFMAVLKSPKTSEKEVCAYAKNRALDDEIIRTISHNRDWTKLYSVRHSLVQNPKTAPAVAMNFLKTLNPRDVRNISHSHDVPGYVVRAAKRLLRQREEGRSK